MAENHFIDWKPAGRAQFYHNVPLDNSYNHSLAFENRDGSTRTVDERLAQFAPYQIEIQQDISFTRVNNNTIRVGIQPERLYDCNYVIFHNQWFPNTGTMPKWWFCFVLEVNFINPSVTEIVFEVDVIQTWCEKVTLGDSFIAREHSPDDVIGYHLQPEDIEIGEYQYTEIPFFETYFQGLNLIIATTLSQTGGDLDKPITQYSGLAGGTTYLSFPENEIDKAAEYIKHVTEIAKVDGIISLFFMPAYFATDDNVLHPHTPRYELPSTYRRKTFDGYTPNNTKLFTYPYRMIYVTDGAGHSAEYKFERFIDQKPLFTLWCPIITNTQACLIPSRYNIPSERTSFNDFESLDFVFKTGQYPQLTFNIDTWKRWVASNAIPTAVNTLANVTQAAFSGNAIGGLVGSVSSTISQVYQHVIQPNEVRGATGGELSLTAVRQFGIHMYIKEITAGYARVVDNFFDMFGYKSNTIHRPRINSRPFWTFVQTKGCNITGSMPANAASKIVSIFDTGITFWNNLADTGEYTKNAVGNRGSNYSYDPS